MTGLMTSPTVQSLLEWGSAQGVQINGILPKNIIGRGLGMVATRDIRKGETLVTVPSSIARSVQSTPDWILEPLSHASCQAVLAVSLCLERDPGFTNWKRLFPTWDEVNASHPMRWPRKLVELLPRSTKSVLHDQEKKFWEDWLDVKYKFPGIGRNDFLHAWIIVNSRAFLYNPTAAREGHRDHVALVPVADLFNHHTRGGCSARHEGSQYVVRAVRNYQRGEELHVNYGKHSNDYLLVEYGFVMPDYENFYDITSLDEFICGRFTYQQATYLKTKDAWGHFELDTHGAVYRTKVALRLLTLPEIDWPDYLDGKKEITAEDMVFVNGLLREILGSWQKTLLSKMRTVEYSYIGEEGARDLLRYRLRQLRGLLMSALSRLDRPGWE
ncbi:hypothetical protein B0I35DRAFT_413119 [Stachybotrys elegans]|uniref:SET domain-containing protein n=1 Tax=Stachybotrys elegans TaxID=80388 RepID=A0A8K0WLS0_9HYPO|nr:hypothetical protein B0I35DRAFT_413119 [Stachybotrys elegans]